MDQIQEIERILSTEYEIGNIENIEPLIAGGYFNTSFTVRAGGERYFLQVAQRERLIGPERNIDEEAKVLENLSEQGFPCNPIVRTKKGRAYVQRGDISYVVTPFQEGHSPNQFNTLSTSQLQSAAKTLARFHKLMQTYNGPEFENNNTATYDEAVDVCERVITTLDKKREHNQLDEFDQHVDAMIRDKLAKLKAYDQAKLQQKLANCPRHYCHGDYHGSNLIFEDEDSEKIAAVVDWEYLGTDYRIWDVMRSMSFMCDIDYNGSMNGPIDTQRALTYLQAYHEENPLTENELDVAIDLIQFMELRCCFVLQKHYDEKDLRSSETFRPKDPQDWFWWIDNGQEFKTQVLDKLIL